MHYNCSTVLNLRLMFSNIPKLSGILKSYKWKFIHNLAAVQLTDKENSLYFAFRYWKRNKQPENPQ